MASQKDSGILSLGAALLGVLGSAASTGLLSSNAEAAVDTSTARRREEDSPPGDLLLVTTAEPHETPLLASHGSHGSHSSHSSHSSHYSGSGQTSGSTPDESTSTSPGTSSEWNYAPAPKPAVVSVAVYPGGEIFIDGVARGTDVTGPLTLTAGLHLVRVKNRFIGGDVIQLILAPGQTGVVELKW